jgi:hypothetical protein
MASCLMNRYRGLAVLVRSYKYIGGRDSAVSDGLRPW